MIFIKSQRFMQLKFKLLFCKIFLYIWNIKRIQVYHSHWKIKINFKLKILKTIILFTIISCGLLSCKEKPKEFFISKREALEIAKKYNTSGDSVNIYFKTYIYPKNSLDYKKGKRKLLYWHVSKKCDHCAIIQIDAENGNVFTIGKYKSSILISNSREDHKRAQKPIIKQEH